MKNDDFFAYTYINYIYRDKESSKSRKAPLISRKLQVQALVDKSYRPVAS